MTSWKRMWGKKTKNAHKKIVQRYDQWLQDIRDQYGPLHKVAAATREIKRDNRIERALFRELSPEN